MRKTKEKDRPEALDGLFYMEGGRVLRNDIEREWNKILEKERKYFEAEAERPESKFKGIADKIEKKIPEKLTATLETAFYKAFFVIFEKGTSLIEKTFNGEDMALEFQVNDFRVDKRPDRRSLKRLEKAAKRSKLKNSCITTVEGIGLGVAGIGLPDIPIFLGMLLKGLYEMAVSYGYDYTKKEEQVFLMRIIYTGLAQGEEKVMADLWTEDMGVAIHNGTAEFDFNDEVMEASSALSMAMLTSKFVQGFFIVGAVGGAMNLVIYRKVLGYAAMKYKKRYLYEKLRDDERLEADGDKKESRKSV